jgi:PKD repeat protein
MKPNFTNYLRIIRAGFRINLSNLIKKALTPVIVVMLMLFNITESKAACKAYFADIVLGDTVVFHSLSVAGDSIISYSWTFGDGKTSTAKDPVHKYSNAGNDTVCLTITTKSGCTSNYCSVVTIAAASCQAYFTATVSGDTATFYNFSLAAPGDSIISYTWEFGDGTTGNTKDPMHKYKKIGMDTVCLTIKTESGCTSSYCREIIVTGIVCNAAFTSTVTGDTVKFINKSTVIKADSIIAYIWTFGDGTEGDKENPSHKYLTAGTYTACLTIITKLGCSSSYCSTVTISNACDAYFTATITGNAVQFNDYSTPGGTGDTIIAYAWTFGDGTIGVKRNPTHEYKDGTYNVCLKITTNTGCSSSYCRTIKITNTSCSAYFYARVSGDTAEFYSTSLAGAGDSIIAYEWNFGDGTHGTGKTPIHTYKNSGKDTVCLTILTLLGCTSTYCHDVEITSNICNADFTATVTGDTAQFNSISAASAGDSIIAYNWRFGDGSAEGTGKNITHVYKKSGTYTVCLTIVTKLGCSSTDCQSIATSANACDAGFTASITGDTVQFNNTSKVGSGDSIIIYYWSFGDGGVGTQENPTHIYSATGTDTVCLTIITKLGCSSSYCKDISVVNNSCEASFTSTVSGSSVQFNNSSTAGTGDDIISYSWNFGDSTSSNQKNPSHEYNSAGTFNICLTIITKLGCTSTICRIVTIVPTACMAYFNSTAAGDTVTFDDFSTAGAGDSIVSYSWNFGDKTSSNQINPVHIYSTTGTDTVCLSISTKLGCTSNYCSVVKFVNTNCQAYFTSSLTGDSVQFNDLSSTGSKDSIISYSWTFGDDSTGMGRNPVHIYEKSGIYTVCLTIQTKLGCTSNYCGTVTFINTQCQAFFNTSISGDTVHINDFSSTSTGDSITSYSWTFGDDSIGSGRNPVHIYTKTGIDTICLTINTNFGCTSNYCSVITVVNTNCNAYFNTTISGDTVQFNNLSTTGTGDNITSYSWTFGDGTTDTAKNPNHVYSIYGIDTVCLTINTAFGCTSNFCSPVTVVNTACRAYFNTTISGDTVQFNNNSLAGSEDTIATYSWSFGDGATGTMVNPLHIYNATSTDTVCLTITTKSGCSSQYCSVITVVNNSCHAFFSTTTVGNTAYFNDYLSAVSVGDSITSYNWSYGDGNTSTQNDTSHVYINSGTDTVCFTINTKLGCTSTYCQVITITADSCVASFYYLTSGDTVYFANQSTTTNDSIILYSWTFGDDSTGSSMDPVHVYPGPGSYIACLTIYTLRDCLSGYCDSVYVLPSGINNIPNPNYSIGQIFPNPTSDNAGIYIWVDNNVPIVLEVRNLLGQELYSNSQQVPAGKSLLNIPTAALPGGLYFVELNINNSTMVVRKLIKE